MKKSVYVLILCGGGGERLWPLSRKKRPKQFVPFLDEKTLLQQTIDRVTPLVENKKNIGVITTQDQKDMLQELVGDKIGFILQEPACRNTAPAIVYSCFKLKEKDENAIVVVLPADSFVQQNDKYVDYLKTAIEHAQLYDKIVTLGVMPTKPATGYGYIQAENTKGSIDCGKVYNVFKFHEKPDLQEAKRYLQQKDMFWNIGVFVANLSVFLNEFKACAPKIFSDMQNFMQNKFDYQDIDNVSIDYAVMEKSNNVVLLPADFQWSDVGNLDVFLSFQRRYTSVSTQIVNFEGKNNIAKTLSKKTVAFIGVSDTCLVENDDVILVVKRSEVEKVKNLIAMFKEDKIYNELL